MESRLTGSDIGFDLQASEEDEKHASPVAYLAHEGDDPAVTLEAEDWTAQNNQKLHLALAALDERSQDILASRWLGEKKQTLHSLADKYGVSAERIRQIESNAMKKLRESIAD